MATSDASQPMSTLAMRLIFEYEGDQVRLVSQQPVDVAITGFDIARTQRAGLTTSILVTQPGGRWPACPPAMRFPPAPKCFPSSPASRSLGSMWRSRRAPLRSSCRCRRVPTT